MTFPFIEIGTRDPEAGLAFFSGALGWTVKGEGDQRYFETPDGPVGLHGNDAPMAVIYFPVPELETAIDRVKGAGGTTMGGINEAPGFGRFVTCADPQGVRFGLHQR